MATADRAIAAQGRLAVLLAHPLRRWRGVASSITVLHHVAGWSRAPARALAAALAIFWLVPAAATAQVGDAPAPDDLWRRWSLASGLVLFLLVPLGIYVRGVAGLWRRAGRGRGVGAGRVAACGGGMVTLAVALVSPLDALAEALFSAHMVQHLLLISVAAPLLVLGTPLAPLLLGLPPRPRRWLVRRWHGAPAGRAAWRWLSGPLTALTAQSLTLWGWHVPALYQAAVRHASIHALEHLSLFGSALLFWWAVIQPLGRRRLGYGPAILLTFVLGLEAGALGLVLTFAPTPWYPIYAARVGAWGVSPRVDQQLAGLIMWIPAGVVNLGAVLALLAAWQRAGERQGPPLVIEPEPARLPADASDA